MGWLGQKWLEMTPRTRVGFLLQPGQNLFPSPIQLQPVPLSSLIFCLAEVAQQAEDCPEPWRLSPVRSLSLGRLCSIPGQINKQQTPFGSSYTRIRCGRATAPGGSRNPKGEQRGLSGSSSPHQDFKPFLDPGIHPFTGQWDPPGIPKSPQWAVGCSWHSHIPFLSSGMLLVFPHLSLDTGMLLAFPNPLTGLLLAFPHPSVGSGMFLAFPHPHRMTLPVGDPAKPSPTRGWQGFSQCHHLFGAARLGSRCLWHRLCSWPVSLGSPSLEV